MSQRSSKDFHLVLPIAQANEIEALAQERGVKPIHVIREWVQLGRIAQASGLELLPDGAITEELSKIEKPVDFDWFTSQMEVLSQQVATLSTQLEVVRSRQAEQSQKSWLALLQRTVECTFVMAEWIANDTCPKALLTPRKELIEYLKNDLQSREADLLEEEEV